MTLQRPLSETFLIVICKYKYRMVCYDSPNSRAEKQNYLVTDSFLKRFEV